MQNENRLQFPTEVLKQILPAEGETVKLGEMSFSKIEYQGKAYIIHWTPAIHVMATASFEDMEKETTAITERKAAIDTLITKFNELKATPVKAE